MADPFAFLLLIDNVGPSPLVQNQPMRIFFSLKNYSTQQVDTGVVSASTGGNFDITTLAAGATVSGSFVSTVPQPGTYLDLQFFILPLPSGQEFPPPNAEASTLLDVAATYMIRLEKIHISRVRSPRNDTDVVALSAQIAGKGPLTRAKSLGDVHEGDHEVDLQVGPFTIAAASSLSTTYLIVNSGFSGSSEANLRIALDTISSITKALLTIAYPIYTGLWAILNALTIWINLIFTADCDGPVAADMITLSSGQLAQMTSGTGIYSETRRYPGTDSPPGCGGNSDYFVTWSIIRM